MTTKRRIPSILIAVLMLSSLLFSLPASISICSSQEIPGDGNESFGTATEIATDGSKQPFSVNFETDLVDFLKFDLQPAQGECINATVVVNASVPDTFIYAMFYTPDRLDFAWNVAFGGMMEVNYSFWAAVPGFYYVSLATMNTTDVDYNVSVTTNAVAHIPDDDNSISEAPEVIPENAYNGRVNRTSDPYDLFKVQVDSNETHGDGLYVHLDNFTDRGLAVYDPLGRKRAYSNTLGSSDPNRGETVRFVANQTGQYIIMVHFESFMPEGEYAYYELTLNKTPGLPHDEDWSVSKAVPTTLGLHNGSFDSSYDEYDYLSIDLTEGDEFNISFIVEEADDWDVNVRIFDPLAMQMSSSGGGSGDYYTTGTYIESNGTHYIEIHNSDLKVFNYTYLITTDGTHFGNTWPLSLNQSSDTITLVEDTNTTYDLATVFDGGGARNFSYSPGENATGNIDVNLSESGLAKIIPAADWFGNATLTFGCSGFFGNELDFTLNVSVTPVNDAPFFADIAGIPMPALFWIHVVENEWKNFTANITDPDNTSAELTVTVTGDSDNLAYDPSDGMFHYLSLDGSVGTEEFTVRVSDGMGGDTQTINFDITSVNDAPVARPILLISGGNGSLTVTLTTDRAYDEEGDDISYLWMFGDGYNEMDHDLLRITHTYAFPGTYLVVLEVNDSKLWDRVSLEIIVTLPDGEELPEPYWVEDLPDEPVGINANLQVEITSTIVVDRQISEGSFLTSVNSTYDISGTCGQNVNEVYLYYGVEQPFGGEGVWWRPIDEEAAIIEPVGGTWSLNFSKEDSYLMFSELAWIKILAMAWGEHDYNVDLMDADYEFIPYVDNGSGGEDEVNPSLWKNLTTNYTDKEKDDMYQIMEMVGAQAKLESGKYGERPELDIENLNSCLNGSSLHIELTLRGKPVEEPEMDIDNFEDVLQGPFYKYTVYFVDTSFGEPRYETTDFADSGPDSFEPNTLFGLSLEYPIPYSPLGPDYTVHIKGNTICWDVPLSYLSKKGFTPSTSFELFATASMAHIDTDTNIMYQGYDSSGFGAYSPDTSDTDDPTTPEDVKKAFMTGIYICGGIAAVVVLGIIILVVVLVSRRKKKPKAVEDVMVPALPKKDPRAMEEEVNGLIREAQDKGMRVIGYQDDLDNLLTHLTRDGDVLCERLEILANRIKNDMDPGTASAPAADRRSIQDAPTGSGENDGGTAEEAALFQQAERADAPPVCTSCGAVSTYYFDHDCYWCDSCQEYVYPPGGSAPAESFDDIEWG